MARDQETSLKGGMAVGSQTAILHMWRESVNPTDDMPVMPHPTEEPERRVAERVIEHQGPQYEFAPLALNNCNAG